ncbi:MAG: hypothetical protein M3Q15_01360 [Pseudomonadota bacterium]|nr:hypothetical protein [Pseudomonadota bacterium]
MEKTNKGCIHPCTVSDVEQMLRHLPATDWAGLSTFLFRQPTRKQQTLVPAWGRLLYFAEVTTSSGKQLCESPVIVLEAVEVERPIHWSKSLGPADLKEMERLKADAHIVERTSRGHEIIVTPSSARNTQLYRTLLHEIGHWFDWLTKVERPAAGGVNRKALEDAYFGRPEPEREAFAHRYAEETRTRLRDLGSGLIART